MLAVRVSAVIEWLPPKKHKRIADRRIRLEILGSTEERNTSGYWRRMEHESRKIGLVVAVDNT